MFREISKSTSSHGAKCNKLTKTSFGQVVPMIHYATITFNYDPNGENSFLLTVWITEMKIQNQFGVHFCQNYDSKVCFNLHGKEMRQPTKTFCYGSLHQNKYIHHGFWILTVQLPYTMNIAVKSARYSKCSPEDYLKPHFLIGSSFEPNSEAVSTGLVLANFLCTQSKPTRSSLIENIKNRQRTLPKGPIVFSYPDVKKNLSIKSGAHTN